MKRIISVVLTLAVMLFSAQLYTGAETSAEITVSNAEGKPGDNIIVEVSINNNPGINTFALGFEYSSKLQLEKVTVAPELGGQFQYSKKAVWLNGSDTYYNGKILTLLFHIIETASNGDAEIKVTFKDGEISNYNEDDIAFRSVPGKITVTGSTAPTSSTSSVPYTVSTTASTASTASSAPPTSSTAFSTSSSTSATVTEPVTTTATEASSAPYTEPTGPSAQISSVVRIAGTDRLGTALAISQRGWHSAKTVIIANAYNYPDALAGAVLSKLYDAPILLTDSKKISNSVMQEIRRLGAEEIIILGGMSAVSKDAEYELSGTGAKLTRLEGENRNGTAAQIAGALTDRASTVFLVNNNNFADALSVSSIAAIKGIPILYISPDGKLPAETGSALQALGCVNAYIIGGSAAIDSSAESNLKAIHVTAERISGDDRYLTSLAVCERFADISEERSAALATGKNFPDALAGAAFAAKKNIPVILVGDTVSSGFKDLAAKRKLNMVYAFGGKSALSDSVLSAVSDIMNEQPNTESIIDWLFSCGK